MKYLKPHISAAAIALKKLQGAYKGGPLYNDPVDPCLPLFTINACEADE
jgi:hypothetical protein